MLRFFAAAIGLFFTSILSAQWCGTPQGAMLERTDANKLAMIPVKRGAIKYVPLTFHLVASTAGTGRASEESVLAQIASLNVDYADQEFKFYLDRFNYFDNDAVYNMPGSAPAKVQMRLRDDNNSINIFVINNIESTGPGTTLAYFDPQDDWLVSRKTEINGSSSTLAHEVGHFFSLPHPFVGWECVPFTLAEYTNPVNVNFTKPCEGGGGSVLIELHDRSNCNTAGDRICDTPEDYNLGLFFQNNCADNTVVMDKNGELITPMENNYMSYYSNCAEYAFTQTQKNLMNTDFLSGSRAYIRTGVIPSQEVVEAPVQYISPINGIESNGITDILLDWEDTPGANRYLIVYDRLANFNFNPIRTIVTSSEYLITADLMTNTTYYWRVWPFNECMTGEGFSPTQNFRAAMGVGVNEINGISEYSLSPNPVADHSTATLTLTSDELFSAVLEITDGTGQVFSKSNMSIPSGISQHPVETNSLPVGIYYVFLHSEKGRLVERLLILD